MNSRRNIIESNDPELVEGSPSWFVHICISRAGHYYVGISRDPYKRVKKHNSGHGAKMAVDQKSFTLVYVSDPIISKSQARGREIQLKKWSRKKKQKLITGEWI